MQQINIHEAKTNLSKLIEQAVHGEPFIIAKSGKPMVTVTAYTPSQEPAKRVGFMRGMITMPKDFDTMGQEVIQDMFAGEE
ncbi:type II toxin-antitoxin system Phd/YefM family antitoxin [Desulfovibrio cuneatus]|uniref:type II toxin-antitoxin system Phd/YefM family antitoxin n=1 Tax=Desulfovibrio cuneatus TaxID=159728 RepID=UPI0004025A7B|nr:type II toxin-antitoxin system prevent-host-death family antitoxin [Desulfovibrio cuneatus]